MKKLISNAAIGLPLAALIMSGCGPSVKTFDGNCADAQSGAVVASKFSGDVNDVALTSEAWDNAQCTSVMLYPQKTVGTNDKAVNDLMADAKGIKANVKALYNDDKVALMVYWNDSEASHQAMTSDKYSDGFAVQFAQDSSDAAKLPYIGMGSEDRPVVIYLQKTTKATYEPNGNGEHKPQRADQSMNKFGDDLAAYHKEVSALGDEDYQKAFIAEGFRSTTELRDAKEGFDANMMHGDGKWMGTLVRDIKDANLDLSNGEFPIALAVWDGKKANRDGQKWLSGWVAVELGKKEGALEKAITDTPKGDVTKGKTAAVENCAACHIFDDQDNGMPFMAPNLSEIGGQATAAYLRESIVAPSAVVVPGYNRNAHPNYKWYELADGKRVSTMPAFDWMSEDQINDLVAYFKTLK
jgi:complex iron-sulfur molybdoenzyme family reductase subunit gamma